MSESKHDLATEFPQFKEAIHELKTNNAHFLKLFEQYHDLNKTIYRSETRIDLKTDDEEEQLRRERLKLKDELYSMLTEASK